MGPKKISNNFHEIHCVRNVPKLKFSFFFLHVFCFACRVVNVWNSLPLDSNDFRSLHCFRSSLSNIDFSRFLIVLYCIVFNLLENTS